MTPLKRLFGVAADHVWRDVERRRVELREQLRPLDED